MYYIVLVLSLQYPRLPAQYTTTVGKTYTKSLGAYYRQVRYYLPQYLSTHIVLSIYFRRHIYLNLANTNEKKNVKGLVRSILLLSRQYKKYLMTSTGTCSRFNRACVCLLIMYVNWHLFPVFTFPLSLLNSVSRAAVDVLTTIAVAPSH